MSTTREIVLIPGSMGTASYVGAGLGNAESFETCQHGAGRTISRTAARKAKTSDEAYAEMAGLGGLRVQGHRVGHGRLGVPRAADEAAHASRGRQGLRLRLSRSGRTGSPVLPSRPRSQQPKAARALQRYAYADGQPVTSIVE
jgi:tRNA-splicing ligase RtcB